MFTRETAGAAEAAQKEAQDDAEREARGETMDGSTLEMMYERQRQLERLRKSGKTVELAPGQGDVFANIAGDDAPEEVAEAVLKLKCELCKKTLTTNAQWQEHINSSKHKTKAKQAGQPAVASPPSALKNKAPPKRDDDDDDDDEDSPVAPRAGFGAFASLTKKKR